MKKLLGVVVSLAMVLTVAGGASAFGGGYHFSWPEFSVKNDDIKVITETEAKAETGENSQWAFAKFGDTFQKMTTGVAVSEATANVAVGVTSFPGCGCFDWTSVKVDNDDFFVKTETEAKAETGENRQWAFAKYWQSDANQQMWTGNAGSTAGSAVVVGVTDFSVGE